MQPTMVDLPYSREFPHAVEDCYQWLTDYTDDDPALTTQVIKARRVTERKDDRVVMEVRNELLGRALKGTAEVRLFPKEHRYEARSLHGDGGAILYTYQLTPVGPGRTRLEVHYQTRVRKRSQQIRFYFIRPILARRVHTMWEGFAAAMARDLAAQKATA